MDIQIFSHSERPEFADRQHELESDSFPEFLLHDGFDQMWPRLLGEFGEFQLYVCDRKNDKLVAVANALPCYCDPETGRFPGFQELLLAATKRGESGVEPNSLFGIQTMVSQDARGKGVPEKIKLHYRKLATQRNFEIMASPIRPVLKHLYPLTPIERYVQWTHLDGSPFDPWFRLQKRLGGRLVHIAYESTVITGSIADWESWTGLRFPESGQYVIPGGHVPLGIDVDMERGRYAEPHVWYRFDIR